MWDWGGGWLYWTLMPLMMVGFWVAVVWVTVLVVRNGRPVDVGARAAAGRTPEPNSAEAILAERYARGEIDDAEYRRRLETLRGGSAQRAA